MENPIAGAVAPLVSQEPITAASPAPGDTMATVVAAQPHPALPAPLPPTGPSVDVDIDALRAARADGRRTKTLRVGGQVYQVPARMPAYFGILVAADRAVEAFKFLLGDDAYDAVFKDKFFAIDDIDALITALYGQDSLGEASASAA